MSHQFTTAHAVYCIRDYYNLEPHESALGKHREAFARAKAQYIAALIEQRNKFTEQITRAETITFEATFPKHPSLSRAGEA